MRTRLIGEVRGEGGGGGGLKFRWKKINTGRQFAVNGLHLHLIPLLSRDEEEEEEEEGEKKEPGGAQRVCTPGGVDAIYSSVLVGPVMNWSDP